MNLAKLPRKRYTLNYTAIEKLNHFSEVLGGPSIYIKRDDLLGLTAGGNKTRKLEFLVADALSKGCDTLITCGGIQSNHCRLTVAAAIKERMECYLVLEEGEVPIQNEIINGNYFLNHLLGAGLVKVVSRGTDLIKETQKMADDLSKSGKKPYIIPLGGSNALGATGYVSCAQEILTQSFDQGIHLDTVLCVSGSGGMQAGLVTGFNGSQSQIRVIGINVMSKKMEQEEKVYQLVKDTSSLIGISNLVPRETVTCFDEYIGPGYGLPTFEMVEAVKLMARTEGILLDPIYTGKAVAGLIDLVRKGSFKPTENILLIHSGGVPALYANTPLFL